MKIADYFIHRRPIAWLLTLAIVVFGGISYQDLGRLEDPEFTVKEARIYTRYPGATPTEVEEEITHHIEDAVQQLSQLKRVTSSSWNGLSEVKVVIRDQFRADSLPQIWDELRRKVNDISRKLPPGASKPVVVDDFGDVYGIYLALTGEGFSNRELYDQARFLKRELLQVANVAKIQIAGQIPQQIKVEISRSRLSGLGIHPLAISDLLYRHNLVSDSGHLRIGDESIQILPNGGPQAVEALANLTLQGREGLVRLGDITHIEQEYREEPSQLIRNQGRAAVTLALSNVPGSNIVTLGDAVDQKLLELEQRLPAGMQLESIYSQPSAVKLSVAEFIKNLVEAVAIVIAVLLLAMGFRSGLLIGGVLLLTIGATFIVMQVLDINLQRVSLGALIIAMGMLVDNAIVVCEGILVRMEQGQNPIDASRRVISQTASPLLGATLVGILAFAAIGLSNDNTGEYTASMFYVILISLMLSWILAVTLTPVYCITFLKGGNASADSLYQGVIYSAYKSLLELVLKYRITTIILMLALLAMSVAGFGLVKRSFFPNSTQPVFYLDYWRAEATDIRATNQDILKIEKWLATQPEVVNYTSFVGRGAARHMLVYSPKYDNSSYAQIMIRSESADQIDAIGEKLVSWLDENLPDAEPKVRRIRLGPGREAKIEARFSGADPDVLRSLSEQAKQIMRDSQNAANVRDDWRQKIKQLQPDFSAQQARRTGLSRQDLIQALQQNFSGTTVGLYRDGTRLMPIVMQAQKKDRLNLDQIHDLPVWGRNRSKPVPLGELVSNVELNWIDPIIQRRNRKRTMTTSCDQQAGLASELFAKIKPQIEAIPLPPGYQLAWGGEYEDSTKANQALGKKLPLSFLAMLATVILLFGRLKQSLVIWLIVPLSLVGITAGLLGSGLPFGFMALLGALSLSGMLIKNAIVLVDQIDQEIAQGKPRMDAIVHSALSRARPVLMAALTTILGMLPLLSDAFFNAMAVVIMAGLAFATLLTLLVAPLLYAVIFKISATETTG
ncbi:efflux RND transporter permease subunit [Pelagibaculum spongiae]|uniref:AcrB/AcrD/AcrF family protein n=1 Tax=Pelagibaculum spongiae TaxID=2080658 RepID=A0A2V1H0Q7_9GAMM|nr:efflux RND transporter permease subunit [Pelagibaculum spongiae]PVZ69653.1 AcrB/AcrD/AcrF family protein [Pelagibaculum spongiae]